MEEFIMNDSKDVLTFTKEQDEALKLMKQGVNVFLSGMGGTGKSTVIKRFIEGLPDEELEKTIILGPTGIAALNIGGSTIHSTFKLAPKVYGPDEVIKQSNSLLDNINRIIIDEISMTRMDIFTCIARYIQGYEERNGKKIQVILIGDFHQLKPVITPEDKKAFDRLWGTDIGDGYAFQSPLWEKFNLQHIYLKEIIRQKDEELVHYLNNISNGTDINKTIEWLNNNLATNKFDDAPSLFGTNRAAKDENEERCRKFKRKTRYQAKIKGKFANQDKPTEDVLMLASGMRIMALVNDSKDRYQNGSLGKIRKVDDNSIYVDFDNGCSNVRLKYHKFSAYEYKIVKDIDGTHKAKLVEVGTFTQIPVKIAYGFTIHKSQGQTFEKVNIDPKCWDNGQLYVALSRGVSREGIHLISNIKPNYVKVNKVVEEFYNLGKLNTIFPKINNSEKKQKKRVNKKKMKTISIPISAEQAVLDLINSREWD